jgi:TP901 family phage tail tape measure protein
MPILIKILANDQGSAVLDKIGAKAKQLESQSKKTGNSMMAMFGGMAFYSAAAQVLGGLGALNKEMDTYQLNLKKIQEVGGVAGVGLGQINDQMKKLALTTEFTHTQISSAGLTLARMGINTAETMGRILPNAMNLATIAGEDLNETAQGLGQIFTIFNIKGTETTTATNKIGQALNLTALDLKGYIEALQYAGGASVAAKVSFDDISAAVAYLSQKAIMGSRAGTTMKNILISMIQPGSDTQKVMKANGLAVNDLVGLFDLLSKKGAGADKIIKMFGMWATPGALGLQQGAKDFATLRGEIAKASYDAAEHARIIREENLPAYQQMLNAVVNLGMSFGEALGVKKGGVFLAIRDELIKLAGYVKTNEAEFRQLGRELVIIGDVLLKVSSGGLKIFVENFRSFGLLLAGLWINGRIAKIPMAIGKIETSISGMANASTMAGKAMAAWMGPINAAIIAMTALNALYDYRERRQKGVNEEAYQRRLAAQGSPKYIGELKELSRTQRGITASKNDPVALASYRRQNKKIQDYLQTEYGWQPELGFNRAVEVEIARQSFVGPKTPAGWTAPVTDGSSATLPSEPDTSGVSDSEKKRLEREYQARLRAYRKTKEGFMGPRQPVVSKVDQAKLDYMSGIRMGTIRDQGEDAEKRKQANDEIAKIDADFAEKEKQEKFMFADQMIQNAGMTADAIIAIDVRRHEAIMANLEKERVAMDSKYDRDIAAAGDNTFKRTMVEQKYAKNKETLDKKMDAQKAELAKKELARQKVDAVATYLTGLINLFASGAKLGPWGMAAYTAIGVAAGIPLVMQLTAKNYREGGIVGGSGNGSSDSEWARVSRGERVLSVSELSRLGGNERVQQMLDRGATTSSRTVNVNIGTVYGSKQFVRELIPAIKAELSR